MPFAEPAWYLTGYGGTSTLWLLPCSGLVILRWGNDPKDWETSAIPNLLLTGNVDPRQAGRYASFSGLTTHLNGISFGSGNLPPYRPPNTLRMKSCR